MARTMRSVGVGGRLFAATTLLMCGSMLAAALPANRPAPTAKETAPLSARAVKKPARAAKKAVKVKTTAAQTAAPAAQGVAVYHPPKPTFRASRMQGTFLGTPGLWSTQFAETLQPGQASSGIYVQRYSRAPGGLVITDVNTGWAVGVTKWLELSFDTTPYRRIRVTHPEQLSFAQTGTLNDFNPTAPFARDPLLHGAADWGLAATFGLLSQDRGDPFGLAVQVAEHLPYHPDFHTGVGVHGVSTTEARFNDTLMIDKWLGNYGEMAVNVGYQHNGTADAGGRVFLPLRDQLNYQFGEIFPMYSRLQGIVELGGHTYFGAGADPAPFGVPSPLDLTVGVRINPISIMGLNLGYRFASHTSTGNEIGTNVSGFVFGVSFGPPAPPAPLPPPPTPTLACQVDQATAVAGTSVHVTSTVSPQGVPYTYAWTSTGGHLTPNDSTATLDTTGMAPGMYTIKARVDNGQGGTADCTSQVEVRVPVKNPPQATCSVEPTTPVQPGATLTFSGQATSPDQRPLTYAWTIEPASAGHLDTANQATAHLDTTGAGPGPVKATLTVSDDRGLSASCSATGTVQAPPPPPEAALASTLQFKPNSSRVDNAAKAALDDVALRLQQDASASAVIVGEATPTELRRHLSQRSTLRLAELRAENAKAYLVKEKGIAADRIQLRQSLTASHRAEVWVVPQGASYAGPGQVFTPTTAASSRHRRPRRRR